MRLGVDHLAETLRRVTGAATGVRPEHAAKLVADIDLDRPLLDTEQALVEMSRIYLDDAVWFHEPTYAAHLNCPVVIPALLAEVFVSAVNSSLDTFDQSVGGTFVERHLVDWTAQRIGFGRRRRRHLHQRRHPVQPAGPAAGPRPRSSAATATPPGCGSSPRPTATSASRRRPGCSGSATPPCSPCPSTPTAGWTSRALSRDPRDARGRRPGADGGRRHRRHHRLRRDRPAARDRRLVRRVRRLAARRRGVRRRTARLAHPPAPARRHRARRLRDHRLPQDLVPAGLRQRARGPRPGVTSARHLARRLPEPPASERGSRASQPGRQEPADHAALRRAQAVAHAADDGSRPDRRVRRHHRRR